MPDYRDFKYHALDPADLYRTAPVGLCILDAELRYIHINDELAAINGLPAAEHIGRTLREVIPKIADVIEGVYARVIETGEPELNFIVVGETAVPTEEPKTWHVSYYPMKGENGEVIAVSTVVIEVTELKKVEDELRSSEERLREQSRTLELKNAALKELLAQIEFEKKQVRDDILSNVYELVNPVLHKLKQRIGESERVYVELLEHNLEELVAPFGKRISDKRWSLSPREKEICNMIREGLSTKEIADTLRTSARTIDNHRTNIRKKLGIANRNVNLTTFLQSI